MARNLPSMTALLGLLAVAGYQNRDKISEMLRGETESSGRGAGAGAGGAGIGGLLGGGLRELMDRFNSAGHGQKAASWVSPGPNQPCSPDELREAIGSEALAALTQKTGLPEEELLARLCRTLPDAVDQYTPEGRLPA